MWSYYLATQKSEDESENIAERLYKVNQKTITEFSHCMVNALSFAKVKETAEKTKEQLERKYSLYKWAVIVVKPEITKIIIDTKNIQSLYPIADQVAKKN